MVKAESVMTRGRIELPSPAWEAGVLTAWPTGLFTCSITWCYELRKQFTWLLNAKIKIKKIICEQSFMRAKWFFYDFNEQLKDWVHHRGLEPRTHWLRVSCSTIWANGAYQCRRRPMFPGRYQPSIFSEDELNFCVRHGNRCDLISIVTDLMLIEDQMNSFYEFIGSSKLNNKEYGSIIFLGQALDRLVPAS